MARDQFTTTITATNNNGVLIPLSGVEVSVFYAGTETPATGKVFASRTTNSQTNLPITTGASGLVEFWAEAGEYDIRFSDTQVPARIAVRTFGWNSLPAAARGIPNDLIERLDKDDLLAIVQELLFSTGDLRTTTRAVTVGTEPSGWLLCDGREVSRATYPALWEVIRNGTSGTAGSPAPFGNGNGTTTFNLPDFKGRSPIGVGNSVTQGSVAKTLGTKTGEEKHTLTIGEMPSHNHLAPSGAFSGTLTNIGLAGDAGAQSAWYPNNHFTATASTGTDAPHSSLHPVLTVNFLVKT